MTEEEKIEILRQFRENVRRLREQKAKSDTREQIAQATPIVQKIMSEAKTLKKITISPPPMIGGPVWTVNPIENLYNVPYLKAHANETIDKEDALRKLAFSGMLMYKLDSVM